MMQVTGVEEASMGEDWLCLPLVGSPFSGVRPRLDGTAYAPPFRAHILAFPPL